MNPDLIGKYIKELRLKNNLSQQELSEIVHVTRQAVSGWENGKNCPDSDILLALSSLFKVSINDILTAGSQDNNIEKVALELVDDNLKKSSKIRKLIFSFTCIIFILLFCFLSFYFINNYNSIKVYRIAGSSDIFRVRDGMLIVAKNELFVKLGEVYDPKKEKQIKSYKLYYKRGKTKYTVLKTVQNDLTYSYKESYKTKKNISANNLVNNLYLEIIYNDGKKEIIKLKVREKYNNKLNILSTPPETKKANSNEYEKIENREALELPKETTIIAEDNNSIPVENNIEPVSKNIEPQQEDNSKKQVQPQLNEINYEEIIRIIMEKGTYDVNTYKLEITDNDKLISISTFSNQIVIDVIYGTIIEEWRNTILCDGLINYFRTNSFADEEQINIDISNMNEYEKEKYNEMNDYLLLVYDY